MSEVLNDRDAVLQAAAVRIINPKNASILLSTSIAMFHLDAAGQVEVPAITITATLVGLEGDVTFTAEGATLSSVTGKSAVVRYQDMQGPAAIVTARILAGGETFSQSCILATVRDGADGGSGARGAGMYFATGSTWSDGVADAATPGGNVTGDVVTISNGSSYSLTKRWSGTAWVVMGAVFDGSLFVTGSINGAALKAGTVDIRGTDGKVILAANAPLPAQLSAAPNLVPRASAWETNYGTWVYQDPQGRPINNEMIILDPSPGNYVGRETGVPLKAGEWYTVSFMAWCDDAVGTEGCVDIIGTNWDSPGIVFRASSGGKRFEFTEQVPSNASGLRVRAFATTHQKQLGIYDVKVERGKKASAWTDSVIHSSNASQFVMPGAIGNTQIGGDLLSTNWNGAVGPGGAGWLLQRSGTFYAGDARLRGSIAGGAFTGWAWPAAGNTGYYLGPEGLLLGNYNGPNGYFQVDNQGNMYSRNFKIEGANVTFKGAINGSVIRASIMALESARLLTPWNRLAPFSVYDAGTVFRGTARGNCVVTIRDFVGPHWGGEYVYHNKRFSSFRKDIFMKATVNGDVAWENLYIEVSYHNDYQWQNVASCSVFCEGRAGATIVVRYTPADGGWDLIYFRARTSQGNTISLSFEVQVFNFNESMNAPYSSSGVGSADSNGGGVGTSPEPWCVDAETTRLPNGGYVRDAKVGDLFACWNFDADTPGVEYAPVNKVAFGAEASSMLITRSGVQIIQSNSTPMTVRDGSVVLTPAMLGEHVVVNRKGALAWEEVTQVLDMGVRDVVKISLEDRMYFAGMDPNATIATHNLEYKP